MTRPLRAVLFDLDGTLLDTAPDMVGALNTLRREEGLDPLPFRDTNGKAEITWIQYKSGTPDRIIVSYS